MLHSLPLFHRVAGQPVIVLGEGEAAEAKRRLVERAGGVVGRRDDRARRALAFVALDDQRRGGRRTAQGARACWSMSPTGPSCAISPSPSVLDRDPVLVAIGTGGASAGLAKQLRLRLETLLPAAWACSRNALTRRATALRARWPDAADAPPRARRRARARAVRSIRSPSAAGNGSRAGWPMPSRTARRARPSSVTLTSDDPEDLTLRQARLLGAADALLFEPGIAARNPRPRARRCGTPAAAARRAASCGPVRSSFAADGKLYSQLQPFNLTAARRSDNVPAGEAFGFAANRETSR